MVFNKLREPPINLLGTTFLSKSKNLCEFSVAARYVKVGTFT